MTGLLIALTLAAWSALCVAAGGWYIHHRYAARLNQLAQHEGRRDRQFTAAADLWQRQIERARIHTLAVNR